MEQKSLLLSATPRPAPATPLRQFGRAGLAMVMAAAIAVGPVAANAAASRTRNLAGATAAMSDERHGGPYDMSEAELQGAGCVGSGIVSTAAAYATNANEVVMVVAGGTLAPSTPTLLGIVMLATVFTSGCAVGAIAAPFAYWVYRQTAPQVLENEPDAIAE